MTGQADTPYKFDGSWPTEPKPGIFTLRCSCRTWTFTGDYEAITKASRGHDDAPWQKHIVTIASHTPAVSR